LCWKYLDRLGNIVSAEKMFLNLFLNIVAFWNTNFVSATMFARALVIQHILEGPNSIVVLLFSCIFIEG
jgi:hypothetical protein